MNWTHSVDKVLKHFEEKVASTAAADGYLTYDETEAKKKWSFSGKFFLTFPQNFQSFSPPPVSLHSLLTSIVGNIGSVYPSSDFKLNARLHSIIPIDVSLLAPTFQFRQAHA